MLEFYTDVIHKARKEHKCEFCNDVIKVGKKYHRQSGKYDGEFFDRKIHMECDNMISEYCSENREYDDISYDAVNDWVYEKHCQACPDNDECELLFNDCKLIMNYYKEREEK